MIGLGQPTWVLPNYCTVGFTVCLSQPLKFNYPQRICTAVYGVGYSPSLFLLYTLGLIIVAL